MRRQSKGFTLIELLIVVAIIGIIAAVAYPNYQEYTRKTRRAEVVTLMTQGAQSLERLFSRVGNYTDLSTPSPVGNAFYTIVANRTASTFTLTASPIAGTLMANDICGSFILTHTGARSNVNNTATPATCWGR